MNIWVTWLVEGRDNTKKNKNQQEMVGKSINIIWKVKDNIEADCVEFNSFSKSIVHHYK